MRNKLLTVLAFCFITAAPLNAKFCPYTATLAIIAAVEGVINFAPEYRRPLRVVQIAAAGGFAAFTARYVWSQFSTQSPSEESQAKKDEAKSHS